MKKLIVFVLAAAPLFAQGGHTIDVTPAGSTPGSLRFIDPTNLHAFSLEPATSQSGDWTLQAPSGPGLTGNCMVLSSPTQLAFGSCIPTPPISWSCSGTFASPVTCLTIAAGSFATAISVNNAQLTGAMNISLGGSIVGNVTPGTHPITITDDEGNITANTLTVNQGVTFGAFGAGVALLSSSGVLSSGSVSLTSEVTGVLPNANGGATPPLSWSCSGTFASPVTCLTIAAGSFATAISVNNAQLTGAMNISLGGSIVGNVTPGTHPITITDDEGNITANTLTVNQGVTFGAFGAGVALLSSSGVLSSGSVSLTSEVTGLLPAANGGTGVATATPNYVFAGPSSGSAAAPAFRALVAGDLPAGVLTPPLSWSCSGTFGSPVTCLTIAAGSFATAISVNNAQLTGAMNISLGGSIVGNVTPGTHPITITDDQGNITANTLAVNGTMSGTHGQNIGTGDWPSFTFSLGGTSVIPSNFGSGIALPMTATFSNSGTVPGSFTNSILVYNAAGTYMGKIALF